MLPEREVRVIAAQIMAGLAYLNEAPRRIMCAPPVPECANLHAYHAYAWLQASVSLRAVLCSACTPNRALVCINASSAQHCSRCS